MGNFKWNVSTSTSQCAVKVVDCNCFYEFILTITISWLSVYNNVFIMCKMSVDFDMSTPVLLQHLQPLYDLPPSVCKHDICNHGKCLGNTGFEFLHVRDWGSKNLRLDKTPKEEVQWGYVWWARGPRRRSVPSYPHVRKSFIQRGADIQSPVGGTSIQLKNNPRLSCSK